jgi:hypothetical protein
MRVGIVQSNYLPWRGYFDFIDEVDLFIVFDDVQYTVRDWRNRNRIKTAQGLRWLSVPVRHRHRSQLICETEIDSSRYWQRDHRNLVATHLRQAPYLGDALALLDNAFAIDHRTISDLNVTMIRALCRYFAIDTPIRSSTELHASGAKTDRLLALLCAVGATTYVSGPSARAYLDESRFRDAGIRLEYKSYCYQPYPQLHGPFEGAVSAIDLVANCGRDGKRWLKSAASAELAVA